MHTATFGISWLVLMACAFAVLVMLVTTMSVASSSGRHQQRPRGCGCLAAVMAIGGSLALLAFLGVVLTVAWKWSAAKPPHAKRIEAVPSWEQPPRLVPASFDEDESATEAKLAAEPASDAPAEVEPGEDVQLLDLGDDPNEVNDTAEEPSLEIGVPGGVHIPPGRPEWVESNPIREGPMHRTAVASGLHARKRESRRELDNQLLTATNEYVNWHLDNGQAAAWLDYDLRYVKTNLLRPEQVYDEVIQVSFGPMHQSHALLEFDAGFRNELDGRWQQMQATSRLLKTAFGATLLLAFVATLF